MTFSYKQIAFNVIAFDNFKYNKFNRIVFRQSLENTINPLQPPGAMASLPRAKGIGVVFVATKTQTCSLSADNFIKRA